jgi:hypothetical protein
MAKRPDLDSLVVPKGEPVATVEAPAAQPGGEASKGYAHTLSYRMTADQYRQLRRFVADQEEKTGKRVTHQAIIEAAVTQWLKEASK